MRKHRPIYVTQTFLPPENQFQGYLKDIWQSGHVTNGGPLVNELESKVSQFLNLETKNLKIVTNGTVALQLALRSLGIYGGEIITTPFTYVATTSAILWEGFTPIYVDINPRSLNIDTTRIEAAITSNTKAIMPVHVFGNPCEIETIQKIAEKHSLSVIYDAAHAFGVKYKGNPIFEYGNISTCSFHATKLFHTIEGGAVYAKDKKITDRIELLKRFGHNYDDHIQLGINAKITEFSAAMGLVNLKYAELIITDRERASKAYDSLLGKTFQRPIINKDTDYNYSYYPIIFNSEVELLKVKKKMEDQNIFPRRYFFPSLNKLPYLNSKQNCPVSEEISKRVLCLPLFYKIKEKDIERICDILTS